MKDLLKVLVVFLVCSYYSCDTELDCALCQSGSDPILIPGENLEAPCRCKEGYLQLGEFEPPSCTKSQSARFGEGGKCVEANENTFYVESNGDCYCSIYTQFERVTVEFIPGISRPVVEGPYDDDPLSTGRITQWIETEEGTRILVDMVNFFSGGNSDERNNCIPPSYMSRLLIECNSEFTSCDGTMLWYEDIAHWEDGEAFDTCTVNLFKPN